MIIWGFVQNVGIMQFLQRGKRMKDSRFYYLLGFMSAILFAIVIIGCTSPLEAGSSQLGSSRWNPLYVVVVDD